MKGIVFTELLAMAEGVVGEAAVDEMRTTRVDSVDGAADHQRPLTLAQRGTSPSSPL
mgnify:CR=1 FL=1